MSHSLKTVVFMLYSDGEGVWVGFLRKGHVLVYFGCCSKLPEFRRLKVPYLAGPHSLQETQGEASPCLSVSGGCRHSLANGLFSLIFAYIRSSPSGLPVRPPPASLS